MKRITLLFAATAAIALTPAVSHATTLSPPTTDLKLWVSAETLKVQDGAPVTLWTDLSGNGNDLTESGNLCPALKTDGPGGHPTVKFTGNARGNPPTDEVMNIPITGEWPQATLVFAGRDFASPSLVNTADQNGAMVTYGTQGFGLENQNIHIPPFAPPPTDPGRAEVVVLTAGYGNDGVMRMSTYQNGKLVGTSADPKDVLGIVFSKGLLGTMNSAGYGAFNGEVSEALFYHSALTDTERKSVEHYLMVKYGVVPPESDEKVAPAVMITHRLSLPHSPADLGRPAMDGLQLWVKPENLPLEDDSPISRWPDASGHHHDLTAAGATAPRVHLGIAGYPIAVMEGNKSKMPPINEYFNVPLNGTWKGVTMLFVGDGLSDPGLFNTSSTGQDSLRDIGAVQFTGGDLAAQKPFGLLNQLPERQMVEVTMSLDAAGGVINTYVNGYPQAHAAATPDKIRQPFGFNNGQIGNDSQFKDPYLSRLSEVLIYDHALTPAERKTTEDYLIRRYTLPRITPAMAAQARSPFSLEVHHLPTTQSWIGNTFPGYVPPDGSLVFDYVQSGIADMIALPDGTVVASSIWDEPHKEIGFYKNGKPLPIGRGGGTSALYSDGKYLYTGVSGMSKLQSGIRRFTLDLKPAPWPGMKDDDVVWFDTKDKWQELAGLTAVGDELFLSIQGMTGIHVVNKDTGKIERTIPTDANPGRLAGSPAGTLWMVLPDAVVELKPDGTPTGKKITNIVPGGIAMDNAGRLIVGENGDRQQVVIYDVSGVEPKEIRTIGVKGGVWAGPRSGEMGPNRLFEINATSVDAKGNIYLCLAGHQMRGYSPAGQPLWSIEDTCFCTVGGFDPTKNSEDYYTGVDHYVYQPGQPAGKDWLWTGITYDPKKFPEMPMGDNSYSVMRVLDKHLLRYTVSTALEIHRKLPGSEILAPCAIYNRDGGTSGTRPKAAPQKGPFIWTDNNDDGLVTADEITQPDTTARPSQPSYDIFVDSKGGIWEPEDRQGIRYTPMQGMTPKGAPKYSFEHQAWFRRPKEFIAVYRVQYFPATDTMYLSGVTWDHPAKGNENWGGCGREAIRYDNWSKPTRHVVSRMPFPENAWTLISMSIANESHLLFVGEASSAVVFVYDTDTGKLLGCVEQNTKLFGLNLGWIDQPGGVRAFARNNGEFVVLAEDSYLEKTIVYRIPPGGVKAAE